MGETNLSVSVRNLVEYSLKSGSIDYEYTSRTRAIDGIVFHQKVQKKRLSHAALNGYSYTGEVSFKETFTALNINITVLGRADGILIKDGKTFVEEIKTTIKPLALVTENPLHIAQAKCYAYFYLLKNGGENIHVLLSYCNIETFDIKEYEFSFSLIELKTFFDDILHIYASWAAKLIEWAGRRNEAAALLKFPYDSYRHGQRDMLEAVYRTIERGKNLFICAPTGIGKTISALFPAVKALERGKADKLFYLTAKTITRKAALDAVFAMEEKGLFAKTIVLTAKDKICFLKTEDANEGRRIGASGCRGCKYANGHFDRINAALADIMEEENTITKGHVEFYAEKHTVCPYEFSLDIALFSDIIICDYNYAFDKRIYLRRFFADAHEKYVFLVDEAHNLVERAREMYSAIIALSEIKTAVKRINKESMELKSVLKEIKTFLQQLAEDITDDDYGVVLYTMPEKIKALAYDYCQKADKWLAENREIERTDGYEVVLELYFSFTHFLNIWQIFNNKFVCYCEKGGNEVTLKLFCVDPGECLGNMMDNAKASVFFSATLSPLSYFKAILGGKPDDYAIMLSSPFPKENAKVCVCASISTKYKKRQRFYGAIADYIYAVIMARQGNYFVFFPSYAFLDNVWEEFADKYPHIKTIAQTPNLDESEKEDFLRWFEEGRSESLAAFAVLGGMFAEGIDLPGDKLSGAVIISVGLPKLSFERSIIADYFNKKINSGFEYAYIYPGMNKVLQAGGRVIRTMTDTGVIVLVDERYCENDYRRLFPQAWSECIRTNSVNSLTNALEGFWRDK